MGNRRSQFNMAHTLATDFGACYFNAATVADDSLITDALVLAAMALPVTGRSKDTLAEQSIALWLQCAIVDGLRLLDLTV